LIEERNTCIRNEMGWRGKKQERETQKLLILSYPSYFVIIGKTTKYDETQGDYPLKG